MSGDLAHVEPDPPRELLVPGSGELVPLDDPEAVARALASVKVMTESLKEAKYVLDAAVVHEASRRGTKTLHLGSLTATVGPDSDVEWDLDGLEKLLDLGLPPERYAELVKTEVTYKVDGNVARQVAGANEQYAAVIEDAKRRVPKRPNVQVR